MLLHGRWTTTTFLVHRDRALRVVNEIINGN
jgi:hypothetical protein